MFWLGTLRRWWLGRCRRIFCIRDSYGRSRWFDPIKVCAAIEAECPQLDDLLEILRGGGGPELPGNLSAGVKDQQKAAGKELVRVARVVFGLPEFDGTGTRPVGVTEAEAIATLRQFLDFMGDLEELARPT